jgi:hypothetical protein
LPKAAPLFDAFITGDRNLEFQQRYADLEIGFLVLVLVAPDNRVETVLAMAPAVLSALEDLRPGQLVRVSA